jgi:hypothetical protein
MLNSSEERCQIALKVTLETLPTYDDNRVDESGAIAWMLGEDSA